MLCITLGIKQRCNCSSGAVGRCSAFVWLCRTIIIHSSTEHGKLIAVGYDKRRLLCTRPPFGNPSRADCIELRGNLWSDEGWRCCPRSAQFARTMIRRLKK